MAKYLLNEKQLEYRQWSSVCLSFQVYPNRGMWSVEKAGQAIKGKKNSMEKSKIILYPCFSAVSTIMIQLFMGIQAKLNQNVDLLCAVTRFYKVYPL